MRKPKEFRQFYKPFDLVSKEVGMGGFATVRTTTTGGAFFAYASVVDNRSGDEGFVPAVPPP